MPCCATMAGVTPLERHSKIRELYAEFQARNGGVRADTYIHHAHRGWVYYPRRGILKKLERHEWEESMAQTWGDA